MICKFFHRQLFQSTAIVVGTIIGAHTAVADDYIIDTPNTATNGGHVLNGNDKLTITDSGTITTIGAGAVNATGTANTIINFGSIFTSGDNAEGILANDNNTIYNFGLISTTGDYSQGIVGNNSGTITNTGSIQTNGEYGFGIYIGDSNTVTNSGSIFTSGYDGEGIQANDNNIITNTGTISTSGENGDAFDVEDNNTITNAGSVFTVGERATGIEMGSNNTINNTGLVSTIGYFARGMDGYSGNTITNSGTIITTGDDSYGMWFFDSNTVINTGTVSTAGVDANAFDFRDNNTFINSGKIVSTQAKTFILGSNNTLNLLAPSFLGGVIDMGTNTTLNITTGSSHSVLWDLSTGTMVGGSPTYGGIVPIFYNATTQKIAILDPTFFAASTDNLADMSGNLSKVIGLRLRGSFMDNSSVAAVTHRAAYLGTYVAISETKASKRNALSADEKGRIHEVFASGKSWVTLMGARTKYDGNSATTDRSQAQWAVVSGYDWSPAADMRFGFMGGYASNTLDANSRFANSYDNQSSGGFAGVYGRKAKGAMFLDFAFTAGVSDHSGKRFVNDNLAQLGVSYAKSSYFGIWVSPEIAIGQHFDMGSWIATPKVQLRYASQWLEGYRETGSNANAVIEARQVAIGEGVLELAATKSTEKGSATLRLGYLYRTSLGDRSTSVTMIDQTLSVPTFGEDRHASYLGGDLTFNMTETVKLELGAQLVASRSSTGFGSHIKLISKF